MWRDGTPLAEIAEKLKYSFSTLAKLRITFGLEKRYGCDGPPTPEVIRIRCLEQQTNWTPAERQLRWTGTPHTIYASTSFYGQS